MRKYHHYVANSDLAGRTGRSITRFSPATGKSVAEFSDGDEGDTIMAIEAARTAFDDGPWPRMAGTERATILHRFAALIEANRERLSQIEMEEVGKPIRFARDDIQSAVERTHYAADLAAEIKGAVYSDLGPAAIGLVTREPVGVVGMIIPWNFPANVFAQKIPFAIATGCCTVVKPSEMTSGSALEFARLAAEAGTPAGVINIVTGYGDPVGETITTHPGVDMVSFTGSTKTGRRVQRNAAETVKKLSLELGGKAANIVFADADLDDACDGVLWGVYASQGQICCSGPRLLVEDKIADRFIERLVAGAAALRVGLPAEVSTDVGALIHTSHMEKVLGYVALGQEEGAHLLAGGNRVMDHGLDRGCFVAPTIFDEVRPDMRIFREEIFGPVLSITRFSSADQAIALANDTRYGLANGVWTKDIDKAFKVSRAVRSGTVYINTFLEGTVHMPFGGYRESGNGREMGVDGLHEFTEIKASFLHLGKRVPKFA